jgi:hypothetical protein
MCQDSPFTQEMAAHLFVVEKVAKQEQTAEPDAEKWVAELFSSALLVIWMP